MSTAIFNCGTASTRHCVPCVLRFSFRRHATYKSHMNMHRSLIYIFTILYFTHRRRKHLKVGGPNSPFLPSPPFPFLCFPSLPHSPQPLPFFPYPHFLRRRPLNAAMISWEHCKFPQLGLGRSPSRQTIWCIFEPKEHLSLRQFFLWIFFSKNLTFCTKNNHDTIYTAQLYSMLTGAREVL